jgi:RimJ/RimL family protein N-acetyltransferase
VIPPLVRTERLLLRPWRREDAAALHPILAANQEHLQGWIPAHVADVAPVAALAQRLDQFGADFAAGRSFRYAVWTANGDALLGEVDLFVRDAERRVPLGAGDRVEIGYWLDAAATGHGFATEAAVALLAVADAIPGLSRVEIRCDVNNSASAAIPQRLGFSAETGVDEMQVWVRVTHSVPGSATV